MFYQTLSIATNTLCYLTIVNDEIFMVVKMYC